MKLPVEWQTTARDRGVDFISVDRRTVVQVKSGGQGLRDLRAALMELAIWLARDPALEHALLAIHLPRITLQRIRDAWDEARSALRPQVAHRLAIAVRAQGQTWVDPPTSPLVEIADAIFSQLTLDKPENPNHAGAATAGTPLFFEIAKVLLNSWMQRQEPLQIQEIMRRVGCSHPSVALALEELERRHEIQRTRDRRVGLRGLPRQTLEELVVLNDPLRHTQWIDDVSGRPSDPMALLARLHRTKPPHVAVGGAVAARHYHPSFDLHGTPRIDLTAWTPRGTRYDPASLAKVYPGLVATSVRHPDAIIAVHRLARAEPLFEDAPKELPYADPVETLLDLYELRLTAQAQAFVTHLRGDAP